MIVKREIKNEQKILTFLAVLLVLTSLPCLLVFGEPTGVLSAEEFSEQINKFARDFETIQKRVNFAITTTEYYTVYGLANGDVEEAIKIFNHPDYPYSAYDYTLKAYESITNKRIVEPDFDRLFDTEIVDFKIDKKNDEIVIMVNQKYANQENFDRYEKNFRGSMHDSVPLSFEVIQTAVEPEDYTSTVIVFVIVSGILIVYFVRKNKI